MVSTLLLTSQDIVNLASPEEYISAVRRGYEQQGNGAQIMPRASLFSKEPPGKLTGYSAILPKDGVMGGYLYSAGFSSKDAWFFTSIFDSNTGEPLAILDGASMNPYKTGAVGALGVDVLARKKVSKLAVIGSGPQAISQLNAALTIREFNEICVYSSTRKNREYFANSFNKNSNLSVTSVNSSKEAVSGADVVITATNSSTPVFSYDHLSPGAHITAVGQYHPFKRELDESTIQNSVYVPDIRSRVLKDAGSFISAFNKGLIDENHIHAELGEVIIGLAPGRSSNKELTVFDSGGTAIETISSAYMLYKKALDSGLGTTIEMEPASIAMQR